MFGNKHRFNNSYFKRNSLIVLILVLNSYLLGACQKGDATLVAPATNSATATASPEPTATVIPSPTPNPAQLASTILLNPVITRQNTPFTNDMGADGYNWSQAFPIQVDKYNKIFSIAQIKNSDHKFVFSNDGGQSWNESTEIEPNLIRGTAAYDSVNDQIHVLWVAHPNNGVFYRRYKIARDDDKNIKDIAKEPNFNLQLEYNVSGTMADYQHPILLWLNDAEYGANGAVLAIWSARNNGAPVGNEVRASMRILTNNEADAVAANWKAPFAPATSTIGNVPLVPYSTVLANTNKGIAYISALRKTSGSHAKDLYFFYADGPENWAWRRAGWNSASADWNTALTAETLISKINRGGVDKGYDLKYQLGSKPVEDTVNDRVYFAFATWKDNANGDTWSHIYVDKDDKLSAIADVYSAGGAHSYAPTGDITFDEATGLLITAYVKTAGGGTYLRPYNGLTPIGDKEVLLFNASEVDLPILWQGGRYGSSSPKKLLVMFRNTAAPYIGYFVTLDMGK